MASRPSPPTHILVLNDSPGLLAILTELLKAEGYRMSGQRVRTRDLPAIVELAPELIILDLLTGSEEAGLVLLQMLKITPRTRIIPVVLCAGVGGHVEAMHWLLDPIGVWVVHKPFTREGLLTAITAACTKAAPAGSAQRMITSPNGRADHEPPRNRG